jgi:hypothetical protein
MNIEQELREALRRPEAPEGFASRVAARIARENETAGRERAARWRAGRAAAAIIVLALGGWGGYRLDQRRRAEDAAEDALVALRIASEKINLAKDNMDRHSED